MNILRLNSCGGGGRFLSLVALATILLGFAAPAYATDKIWVDLDTTSANLQRSGNIYKHNSSVRVRNSNDYGFTLSMNASQSSLVNDKDSSYRIDSVSGSNQQLAANQWGYSTSSDATTFSSVSSASLADVTKDNKGSCAEVDDCTISLTLGANLDPKRLPVGNYSTTLIYTVTSKPAPYVPPTPTPPAPDPEPHHPYHPYVPPEPEPDPEPYVPPAPTWTTNGCRGSYDPNCSLNWRTGMSDGTSPYYPDAGEVKWTGTKWEYSYDNSWVDYSRGSWLMVSGSSLIAAESNHPLDKPLVYAYVPRFIKEGHYIRFCQWPDDQHCAYDNGEEIFKYSGDSGFLIALTDLGCTEHVSAPDYPDIYLQKKYKAAKILIEALGSPCPE